MAGEDCHHEGGESDESGMLAEAPHEAVDRLHEAMMVALKDPDVKSRLEAMGGTVRGSTPDETRQRVVSELARWNKVITEAKIPRE